MSVDYMQITILGCGSSTGVPRVGNDWGLCDPEVPENMRSRCSILLERVQKDKKTSIVIDTGPDFRMQMNRANVKKIDAVFYTHEHADHTHGIDDLRMYALRDKKRIDVYASQNTSKNLMDKFGYCFTNNSNGAYPPILNLNIVEHGIKYTIDGDGGTIDITPVNQIHGNIFSFGFKINNVVYSSDISDIPAKSSKYIEKSDLWIVDSLRWDAHPTHFHVDKALDLIQKLYVKEAILTNLHIDLDYKILKNYLPKNVSPAYDGLIIKFN